MSEKLSTQPYKGTRDFYPQDMRLRNWFFGVMREVLEKSAFDEYNGPMLESLELYAAKSGEEIANEQTYNFTDRGGRNLAIRPEMTPTVARMVAAKMGELKGELEQIVPVTEKCTEVEAVAKEGYTFAYWSCTVGRIEDVKNPKLTFVSPGGFDTERVVVTANFVKSGYLVKVTSSDTKVGTAGILSTAITDDVGWTGIIVAWLSQLNTVAIFLVSALISMLHFGSGVAAATFSQVDSSFSWRICRSYSANSDTSSPSPSSSRIAFICSRR